MTDTGFALFFLPAGGSCRRAEMTDTGFALFFLPAGGSCRRAEMTDTGFALFVGHLTRRHPPA